METPQENSIGYRKPPKTHQFKPGQSGNPKGRPKGACNLSTMLEEELNQKVSVTENGRRRRISKGRLAMRQLANKAAQGDGKAVQTAAKMQQGSQSAVPPGRDNANAAHSELTEEQCWEALRQWFCPEPQRFVDPQTSQHPIPKADQTGDQP